MSLIDTARDAQPAPSQSSSTSPPDATSSLSVRSTTRLLRIGVVGDGGVGRAFVAAAARASDLLAAREGFRPRIVAILASDPAKPRADARVACDPDAFYRRSFDVVVEATGRVAPVLPRLLELLRRGVSVVTANKELVAAHGAALTDAAAPRGAYFGYEATVAAGVPLFRIVDDALRTTRVRRVTAVLNGTTNFVLARVAEGTPFADAVAEAQRLGVAEPDPDSDLSGRDAARKLAVLAWRLGARPGTFEVRTTPLTASTAAAGAAARGRGRTLKHVARLELAADGAVLSAEVGPLELAADHPLADVNGVENGVVLEGDVIDRLVIRGPGAGPAPTAAALLDDVVAAARRGAEVRR